VLLSNNAGLVDLVGTSIAGIGVVVSMLAGQILLQKLIVSCWFSYTFVLFYRNLWCDNQSSGEVHS